MKRTMQKILGFLPRAIYGILHHKPEGEPMKKEDLKFKFIIPAAGENPDAEFKFDHDRLTAEGAAIRASDDPFRPNWYQELLCGESMLLDRAVNLEAKEFAEYYDRLCAPFKDKVNTPDGADKAAIATAVFCGAFRGGNIADLWAEKHGLDGQMGDKGKELWRCQQIVDAYFREKPVEDRATGMEIHSGYAY